MRDMDILAIAGGQRVELGPLDDVAANRRAMLAALEAADKPVYGVNTGMGRLAGVALDAEQQAAHQRNLLIGRAVGGPPWLPEPNTSSNARPLGVRCTRRCPWARCSSMINCRSSSASISARVVSS